jgi:hypothetical protein
MRNRTPVATLTAPLWGRQPGETALSYASFQKYRDLPPGERSLARVSRELGKNPTMIEDRAKRWRWFERRDAWDLHLEEIAVAAQEAEVREMNARHARLGFEGLKLVLARITGDDELGIQAIDASTLSPQDLARLTEVLSKLERLSRGAESERVEQTAGPVEIRLAFNATPNVVGDSIMLPPDAPGELLPG